MGEKNDAPAGVTKTPGVMGGDACIDRTRIPVWLLLSCRRGGWSEATILSNYPTLRAADLAAAWAYAEAHPDEIARALAEHHEPEPPDPKALRHELAGLLATMGFSSCDHDPHTEFLAKHPCGFPVPTAPAVEDLTGQKRGARDGGDWIWVRGCYGLGSGGLLYSVTFPCSFVTSPCGMSHRDVLATYPVLLAVKTEPAEPTPPAGPPPVRFRVVAEPVGAHVDVRLWAGLAGQTKALTGVLRMRPRSRSRR